MSSTPTGKKPFKDRRWWKAVLGIIVFFALIRACAGGDETPTSNTAPLVTTPTTTTRTWTTPPRTATNAPRWTTTTTPTPVAEYDDPDVYVDSDPDAYVDPDPPKRRTGNSGHPCLPGERDGDNDGYCGEG
ncbi:hypothetical protein GCM10023215_52550 [Pseudonocardia yuanmonensis]|uniref:Uncharacterized protein n=1 Tax=Pseudonocardia yuanmonensis TaxID=1095914 RepID=A0ABP8XEF8_9PSEU